MDDEPSSVPPVPPSPTPRPKWQLLLCGSIGLLLILITAVLLFRASTAENRNYAHMLVCAGNLKAIGAAIAEFAKEHDGKLPETLDDLSHYYGSARKHEGQPETDRNSNRRFSPTLFCPSLKDKAHYSYMLTGATNVWGITNVVIVVEIESSHYGKRFVLFDDGEVKLSAPSGP